MSFQCGIKGTRELIRNEKTNLKKKKNENSKGSYSLKLSVFQALIADAKKIFCKNELQLKKKFI